MADNKPFLPLAVQSDIEQQQSWEGISTPNDLARYMARVLAVDPNAIDQFNEIAYSSIQPSSDQSNNIWIKTSEPVAIGIPTSSGYNLFYQYPENVAFLYIAKKSDIPSYLRVLTEDELTTYKLEAPAENKASWVILNV